MSQKKKKPLERSEKADTSTEDAPIRSTPISRALDFLLNKQQENPLLPEPEITPQIEANPQIDDRSSSIRAGSNRASSDSQLRPTTSQEGRLSDSQLSKSRLRQSQLSAKPSASMGVVSEGLNISWRAIEHTRIPQVVFDEILPTLQPMAQMPYLQLLRLTLGFQRANCHISLESWAARCNQSLASIKRQAQILQQRGLLRKENVVFGGVARGSYYRPVIPGILNDPDAPDKPTKLRQSQLSVSQHSQSQLAESYMKDDQKDDQIDLRNKDHHEKEVMRIYRELTGNEVTKADLIAYRKVAHMDLETIEIHMRQIYERSVERIGSFAYFTKGLLTATQENARTRAQQKRNLELIIQRIRTNRIGGETKLADLIEDIKRACARENVAYNTDLVNEILRM